MSIASQVAELEALASSLAALSAQVPARFSTRQALAFVLCAQADVMGRPLTLSALREQTDGVIGQSIEKTIQVFFRPSRSYPDALGWLDQELDPNDRRFKYLRLTPAGLAMAEKLVGELRG